jgi:hypothetical protein
MTRALGDILTILLILSCLIFLVLLLTEVVARAGLRDRVERGDWASLLVGSGFVAALNLAVRLA